MVTALVMGLLLCARPSERARWLMSIGGVPVAEIRMTMSDGELQYDSVQLFERRKKRFSARFKLDANGFDSKGRASEVWWLSKPRAKGCQRVFDENDGSDEEVCFDSPSTGTLEKRSSTPSSSQSKLTFTARYSRAKQLVELHLGGVSFMASEQTLSAPGRVFPDSFEVEPGTLEVHLRPSRGRLKASFPKGVGTPEWVSLGHCLEAAERFRQANEQAIVKLGIVVEGNRATAHAWVELNGVEADPSVEADDPILNVRRYFAFETNQAGAIYLGLGDGWLRLTRK